MPRSDAKKTGGFFKGMLDGLRSSVSQPVSAPKCETEIEENLRQEHFTVTRTVRHGFPYQPTAIDFDPVQRLLAIGTKNGSLRIFGRPGVECCIQHVLDSAVIQIIFLVNEGALISACADDSLHLWNIRQKRPEIVHTLKFQKERITQCHLPFQSKWLYIGTERGNIHIVNIESFTLSGYVINWNKAIELSRKTHPGSVVHLSGNPLDNNKLLVGYETGTVVLWDLRNRAAEARFQSTETLKSVSWHHEGKQFICSHGDGSLVTWNVKFPSKPQSVIYPHAKPVKEGYKPEPCQPITKVEWKSLRSGEYFTIFSGGLPYEKGGPPPNPSLTVVQGKTTTVLEMEHDIIDFVTLCESPHEGDFQEPYAVVVLLYNDLVVVDLASPGYPCFQNPYPMDLHESPVTYCTCLADCPGDLVPAFYSVGYKGNKRGAGFSDKEWPINGGEWGTGTLSYPEIIITGHADGSLKFWDASSVSLQVLYKLKTAKLFERPKSKSVESSSQQQQEDDPFAVELVSFCAHSRMLAVAGASSHVMLFRFQRQEAAVEVPVLEVPLVYDIDDYPDMSPDNENNRTSLTTVGGSDDILRKNCPLRVKSGPLKLAPGFQADLICLTPMIDGEPPGHITALKINSSYGLLAYGNDSGLAIIDAIQRVPLLNLGTPDLYGSADPYQRIPRSPKRNTLSLADTASCTDMMDRCRSPTADQPSIEPPPPPKAPPIPPPRMKLKKKIPDIQESMDEIPPPADGISPIDTAPKEPSNVSSPEIEVAEEARESEAETSAKPSPSSEQMKNGKLVQNSSSPSGPVATSPPPPPTPTSPTNSQGSQGGSKWRYLKKNKHIIGTSMENSYDIISSVSVFKAHRASLFDLREQVTSGVCSKVFNKIDSFSRSRSSSMSSLENVVSSEAIQCLIFCESFSRRGESSTNPTLWVGTSLGSVISISLALPDCARSSQPVLVTPTGNIFRLKGSILSISFLDANGFLIPSLFESWKDYNKETNQEERRNRLSCNNQGGKPRVSPTSSEARDCQFVVLASEKQARVLSLPSQTCAFKATLTETSFVVRSQVVSLKGTGSVCLACYVATGNIIIFSLPSLRVLKDVDFLPLVDMRIARTFCFSNNGHGMYLGTPSELQKFTISSSFCDTLQDMLGTLFLTKEMPEAPKQSFFKGLFGGNPSPLDREELFGESSGKASKSIARHIPGNIEYVKSQTSTLGGELARARQGLTERGEALSQLDEKTARMMSEAESFANAAHQLMVKYKDKKWYQF